MKKITVGLSLLALIFSLSGEAIAATSLQGEVQEGRGGFDRKYESEVIWEILFKEQTIRIITEEDGVNAGAVFDLDNNTAGDVTINFEFARNKRGLFLQNTAKPCITIQYYDTQLRINVYENLLFSKFTKEKAPGDFHRLIRTIKSPGSRFIPKRVAVVAKTDGSTVVRDFADLSIRKFFVNGKQASQFNMNKIVDKHKVDPLLNVASHSAGK